MSKKRSPKKVLFIKQQKKKPSLHIEKLFHKALDKIEKPSSK